MMTIIHGKSPMDPTGEPRPENDALEVLVVGAGPTGLAMAAELARHRTACRIVDRAPQPSDKSKALVVQPRTLEVFDMMGPGLAEEAVGRGQPLRALNAYSGDRRLVRLRMEGLDSPYPWPLILEQSETERILGGHLRGLGVAVERRVELASFGQDDDGVSATLRHDDGREEAVRARWLVGCDGAHSAVRHGLGLPFEGSPYEEEFILADVRIRWSIPAGEAHGFVDGSGLLAALPMPGEGRYRLIAMRPEARAEGRGDPTLEEFQARVDRSAPVKAELSDPTWLADFHLQRRIVPRMRLGRVFLAGDAAHIHSPAGGQGMNTGIQDAANLAWKLALVASGDGRPELLDSYLAERHPVAASVLRVTDRIFRGGMARGRLARRAREILAPLILNREWFQRRARLWISELGVNYRGSPIVGPAPDGLAAWLGLVPLPAPGDRAPDATIARASDGAPARLFELLRDPRHVLLLLGGTRPGTWPDCAPEAIGREVRDRHGDRVAVQVVIAGPDRPADLRWDGPLWLDPARALHRRYEAGAPGFCLIRPDGYVSLRGRPRDGDRLLAHLDRTFA